MADFKTHITASTAIGIAYGTVANVFFDIPPAHCFIAGALCSVAGMLPDLDSDSSVPLREMLSFVSVVIPMLMLRRFEELGLTPEYMVFVAAVMYVVIRFGIGEVFKRFTKHRGMWHSVPAAAIAGLLTYLICLSSDESIRIFKAWATVMGFMTHLLLDELYSVDLMGRRLRKSSGTAVKLFGNSQMVNLFTYVNLIGLVFLVANEGSLLGCCSEDPTSEHVHYQQPLELPMETRNWIEGVFESRPSSVR